MQIHASGQPAGRAEWAAVTVESCRGVGDDLARAISAARASTDTALLDRLTFVTAWLRDGRVFTTALEIARDPAASAEARIFAIRTLIWTLNPGTGLNYASLITPADRALPPCTTGDGPSLERHVNVGAPLPSGWVDQASSTASRLVQAASEPAIVRQAAHCLGDAVRLYRLLQTRIPTLPPETD
ncbi:MAG TPA: hypothetical protein VF665_15455 [Longimicrobium sp.]